MRRVSLRQLVAWVIAQVDGWWLGHSDVDERDSSWAWFVVRQSGERGRQRNIGGDHRLQLMRLRARFYNTKNKAVSTYSLGYRSVSKGKVTVSHALAALWRWACQARRLDRVFRAQCTWVPHSMGLQLYLYRSHYCTIGGLNASFNSHTQYRLYTVFSHTKMAINQAFT